MDELTSVKASRRLYRAQSNRAHVSCNLGRQPPGGPFLCRYCGITRAAEVSYETSVSRPCALSATWAARCPPAASFLLAVTWSGALPRQRLRLAPALDRIVEPNPRCRPIACGAAIGGTAANASRTKSV